MDFEVLDAEHFGGKGGKLVSFLSRPELKSPLFGQIYCAIIEKGNVKGNHYHKEKEEFIFLARGACRLVLEDIESKKRAQVLLDARKDFKKIRIGKNIAHSVECISDEDAIIIEYASEPFNQVNEDKHLYKVS